MVAARVRSLFLSPLFLLLSLSSVARAVGAPQESAPAQKTVRVLVQAMRFGKDDVAIRQLGLSVMAARLMGESWATLQKSEQQQFLNDFEQVLRHDSFVRGRDLFKYLDTLAFSDAHLEANQATLKTTVVVHRNLKKTEVPVTWALEKEGNTWRVVDIITMGERTSDAIHEEQVKPLLAEGGPGKVLSTLHAKAQAALEQNKRD